ncbi:MAG: hypothetical protein KQ78_01480 [Candidatus Izimaplasma bacterium HR2]|nr:MAG: hypothetical protein KQ78_01480 [Candidatus Izimaplasma bacterium HR2]
MTKEAKYIVVKMRTGIDGTWENHIIPFSSNIIHSCIAENFGSKRHIVSAGFIKFAEEGPFCYGRSESLGKDSRPEVDTLLAKITFGDDY